MHVIRTYMHGMAFTSVLEKDVEIQIKTLPSVINCTVH